MNYDAFFAKWNGKQVTAYSGECVALVAQYCVENGKPIAYANAKDWWGHPALTGAFDFIKNNPNDLNQVPNRGDIMIWDGSTPGSGGYGHIGIYDSRVSPGVFRSFDQNWGGRQAHLVTHTYGNIIGWMRPKAAAPPAQGGTEVFQNDNEIVEAYALAGRVPSAVEIAGWRGGSKQRFIQLIRLEIDAYRKSINEQLAAMNRSINDQNKVISELGTRPTKAQLDEAIGNLAKANSDLTTAHDKIKDLENNPDTKLLDDGKNLIQRLIARFTKG